MLSGVARTAGEKKGPFPMPPALSSWMTSAWPSSTYSRGSGAGSSSLMGAGILNPESLQKRVRVTPRNLTVVPPNILPWLEGILEKLFIKIYEVCNLKFLKM